MAGFHRGSPVTFCSLVNFLKRSLHPFLPVKGTGPTCIPFEWHHFFGSSLASGLVWPQGWPWSRGLRLKWAKGRLGSKNNEKVKVVRMEFSIVKDLRGPQESISAYLEAPNSSFVKKKCSISLSPPRLPYFPSLG